MKTLMKCTLLSAFALTLTGCATHRIGDFTVISTKNINLNSNKLQTGNIVVGKDSSAFSPVYLKNAVDNAIEQDKCAVGLSDAVINLEMGFAATYTAKGKLIIDTSLPGCGAK